MPIQSLLSLRENSGPLAKTFDGVGFYEEAKPDKKNNRHNFVTTLKKTGPGSGRSLRQKFIFFMIPFTHYCEACQSI